MAVPDGPFWIADNGTGVATAYNGDGRKAHNPITIPPPAGSPAGTTAAPTGIVLNRADEDDFVISAHGKSAPATLLFATEDGTISGWNPKVDKTHAILAVDNSAQGSVYKGLAQGKVGSRDFIYATDFHNGKVDVFDAQFKPVTKFLFSDPNLPALYAPFGIRNINGNLFVTYAKQLLPDKHDDEAGLHHGFVDVFDTSGNLIRRLVSGEDQDPKSPLDSPWGLALAPEDFGQFGGALLVGNFGHVSSTEASINAFDITTGAFLGSLTDKQGHPIFIDGLWGLTFGDDVRAAESDDLYFTAGPGGEKHGLFGFLSAED